MNDMQYLGSLALLAACSAGLGLKLHRRNRQLEAEKRASAHTRTFHTLFNITRGGLALLDASGRFIDTNPGCGKMFGYQRDELLAMNISDLSTHARDALSGNLGLIKDDGSGVVESLCRCKDGRMLQVEITSTLVPDSNGMLFAIFRDITERKTTEEMRLRLETQLRHAQKLEAIGTLTSGIAHDFNNLLNAILGNSELALQDLEKNHPVLPSLHEIRKAGRRAKELVNRMTSFASPQESKVRLLQLVPVVEDVLKLVRASLPASVDIQCRFASSLPRVLIDESQISQLLLNLCTNSYQAMDQHQGLIEVSLDIHHVNAAEAELNPQLKEGNYVCLQVRDNGGGIHPEHVERIFEPFFTTRPAGDGTGLGLSIVHTIVRGHGAAIAVHSSPGRGASFRILFPVAYDSDAITAEATPLATTSVKKESQHILYVDDEESLVFLTKRLLERHGFRVSGYTDPKSALNDFLMKSHEFDLLITDQSMPGMCGTDLAREILQQKPGTRIVLVSGYLQAHEIEHARSIGIREVITKPNTVDELVLAVQRILSQGDMENAPA